MSEVRPETETETKETPIETVSVIIIKDGNVLTVRHEVGTTAGAGVTGFPGGRLREGETEQDAAIRELREETGLITHAKNLISFSGNFFEAKLNFNGNIKDATMKVFICQDFTGELVAETMKTKPEWTSLDKISKGLYETSPNVLEALQKAIEFSNAQKQTIDNS